MRALVLCLSFGLIFATNHLSGEKSSSEVFYIDDENNYTFSGLVLNISSDKFYEAIKEYPALLVKFWAPWCPYSRKLNPKFEEAASILIKNVPPIVVAEVNCYTTVGAKLCDEYNINDYPTLKFFRTGKLERDYPGPPERDPIVQFILDSVKLDESVLSSEGINVETPSISESETNGAKPVLDQDGKLVLDKDGKPVFEKNGTPKFSENMRPVVDKDGNPVYGKDGQQVFEMNGMPKFTENMRPVVDKDGNPVYGKDGQQLFEIDGRKYVKDRPVVGIDIQQTFDQSGHALFDEEGNPLFRPIDKQPIKDVKKDSLIQFWSPFCRLSRNFVPTLKKLISALAEEDVDVVKFNSVEKSVPKKYRFARFPALFWIPRDDPDSFIYYSGPLELDLILAFVAQHATNELKGYDREGNKKTII